MAEVKNTKKKPTANKSAQKTVDTPVEDLEQTATETAATAEQSVEQPAAEKPVKKKSSKQPKSTQQEEVAASDASEQNTESKEEPVDEANAEEPKAGEQPVATDNQSIDVAVAEDEAEVESKPAEAQTAPAEQSNKPVKTSGKKFALSKKMIIFLAAVLAVVLIAVILAVCLTSCNGGNKVKQYTVTFDTKGGSEMSPYKLDAGSKINRPNTNPTKEMFTFDDWYWENPNKPGVTQKFVFGTTISQNITLIAGWRGETSIKVEFDPNGGKFADDKDVALYGLVGSQMSAPEDQPTRAGYLFDDWYTEEECYNKFTFDVYPVENFTLYAGWAKDHDNYVYISYYGNGELLKVDPVKKGDDVELPKLFDSSIVTTGWRIDEKYNAAQYTAGKATEDLALYTYYYTEGLKFSSERSYATVTGYDGMATEVVVPPVYNGVDVTAIGADAFYRTSGLPAITSVKLPDTITTIGKEAFYDCQYLSAINLTNKVTSIGASAFYRNIRLRSVGDSEGVTTLGAGAFNGCKELRGITLSPDLTEIGEYTFNDCTWLEEISLPAALMSIGDYAFSGCISLKSVVLDSLILQTVGNNAFAGCTNLTEITIAKTSGEVTLQGNPFADCRKVTVYVPSSLLDTYKDNTAYSQFKDKFAAIR